MAESSARPGAAKAIWRRTSALVGRVGPSVCVVLEQTYGQVCPGSLESGRKEGFRSRGTESPRLSLFTPEVGQTREFGFGDRASRFRGARPLGSLIAKALSRREAHHSSQPIAASSRDAAGGTQPGHTRSPRARSSCVPIAPQRRPARCSIAPR